MKASDFKIIDDDIRPYIVPGLSVAITVDDRLVFAKGYGFADTASGRIVTPYSLFRMMSISKSVTSTAVMKLVQQRRFNLTSKVFGPGSLTGDKYGDLVSIVGGVRQYNPGVTSVTVQNLLDQSGWGADSDPIDRFKNDPTLTPAKAVSQIVATVPLAHAPNTNHTYINFDYLVLGRLVADFGETSDYESYVKQNILSVWCDQNVSRPASYHA